MLLITLKCLNLNKQIRLGNSSLFVVYEYQANKGILWYIAVYISFNKVRICIQMYILDSAYTIERRDGIWTLLCRYTA